MSESAKLRDPESRYRFDNSSEKSSARRKNWWKNAPIDKRESLIQMLLVNGQRANKRSSGTVVENLVARFLSELGIGFDRNVQICRYNVDFLLDDGVIIECYGDYWHCNPVVYAGDYVHKNLHMPASERWNRDRLRCEHLEGMGYRVIVIWEKEVKEGCFDCLKQVQDSHQGVGRQA